MAWWRERYERWRYSLVPGPLPKPGKPYPDSPYIAEPVPNTGKSSTIPLGFHLEMVGSRAHWKDLSLKLLRHCQRGILFVGSVMDETKLTLRGDGKTFNLECLRVSLDLWVSNGAITGYKLTGGQTFL